MKVKLEDLPFDEAIKFLEEKVQLPTERWTDLMGGMHSRAFVIAGGMKTELLADMHRAVLSGLEKGTTLADFRKEFDSIVARHGWSYRGRRGWRSAVIFNTNLSTAYSAGHYKQMTDPDVLRARPYWRYIAGLSVNPRPEHLAWQDTVLPADDPWWNTHWPPNGWGCKCMVASLSRREMERDGLKVSRRPDDGTYEWSNPHTGEVTDLPKGIDPGWDYNPGRTAWGQSEALRLMEDKGPWKDIDPWLPPAYGRPGSIPVDAPAASLGRRLKRGDVDGLRASLRGAIGGDEVAMLDPAGERVMVSQAVTEHILRKPSTRWDGREAYFPFIRELIEDPYEIWISFAESEVSGRVAVRKKYVKAIRLDRNRVLGLYAEVQDGHWVSQDFFRGQMSGIKRLRRGRMLYGRE